MRLNEITERVLLYPVNSSEAGGKTFLLCSRRYMKNLLFV